jgi:hypothetical protein
LERNAQFSSYSGAVKAQVQGPPQRQYAPPQRQYAPHMGPSNNNTRQTRTQETYSRPQVQCYNCNDYGHFARQCPKPPMCRRCNKIGHRSNECNRGNYTPQREGQQMIRVTNAQPEGDEYSEPRTEECYGTTNPHIVEGYNEDMVDEPQRLSTISKPKVVFSKLRPKFCSREINGWADYINGNGPFPQNRESRAKTLISSARSEPAANKPVVRCSIGYDITTSILFDTGAEGNVVDKKLMERVLSQDKNARFIRRSGRLTCANGSPIHVLGYTAFKIRIGVKEVCLKKFERRTK